MVIGTLVPARTFSVEGTARNWKSGIGGLMLTPGLQAWRWPVDDTSINLFVRWGLPADERLALTYRHELGHLQTLPVPLVHLFLILWPRRGRRGGSCWLRAVVGLVAHQAVWELAAESYIVVVSSRHDRSRSRSRTGRAIYVILWSGMAFLAAAGTAFLMLRRASSPSTGSRQ